MSRLRLLSKRELMGSMQVPTNSNDNVELQVPNISLLSNKDRRPSRLTNASAYSGKSDHVRIRAVSKSGECNIYLTTTAKHRYLRDIFTTLVDMQWRWTLTVFSAGFLVSWTMFAVLWWMVALFHGDLEEDHLPMNQKASNWTPCVLEVYGFASCFLFSVETQHTTGYGIKAPTDECPDALLLMCIQNIFGLIIEAFLVGTIFAKMTRPKLRAQTIKFSKHAVICKRENQLCLMFRVGDMRYKSRIIDAKIKTQLVRTKRTKEGETLKHHFTKLKTTSDDSDGDLFLLWPATVVHKIDERSPFFKMSASDLLHEHFEIIIILEGTVESTDQKTQARSSYVASEVLWGHRFESVISIDKAKRKYKIDYACFDRTVVVDTPLCSAMELKELQKIHRDSVK